MSVTENVFHIQKSIREICQKINRSPSEIQVVAVTKHVSIDKIQEAFAAGLRIFAESYIQEAEQKVEQTTGAFIWHLVGHLQTNKANKAIRLFKMIQSVDSVPLAEKINASYIKSRTNEMNKYPLLLEVNIGDETSKYGFTFSEIKDVYSRLIKLEGIQLAGLMGMAPYSEEPEDSRRYFRNLYQLREKIAKEYNIPSKSLILSMGMSNDYLVAIEEGSTMVRIGTAIFGERN